METVRAFMNCISSIGRESMVFDWNKAAKIIRERSAKTASAGLGDDWEWTGGIILSDGNPVFDSYTFLSSTWATPEINVDGCIIPCYLKASDVPSEWGSDFAAIKWPESSLKILSA